MRRNVLKSEVVLFPRARFHKTLKTSLHMLGGLCKDVLNVLSNRGLGSISMCWIGLGTEVAVLIFPRLSLFLRWFYRQISLLIRGLPGSPEVNRTITEYYEYLLDLLHQKQKRWLSPN